jgi:hypothetical protein
VVKEEDIPHIIQKAVALELLAIAVNLHAEGKLTPKNLVDEYEKHINKRTERTLASLPFPAVLPYNRPM